jgi:hypothetical protein
MTLTNYPNGISSFGIPVLGAGGAIPLPSTNGNTWFVNSAVGNNGFTGTWDSPFATLAFAASYGNLAAGDTIILMEGHSEAVTAAAGIALATAGVNVVGLGSGTGAPTINFTTATTATASFTGAYTTIQNVRFTCGIASQVKMFTLGAKSIVFQGCQFLEGTATGLSFIDLVGITANAIDGLKILDCYFQNPTNGNMNHAIGLNTVQDGIEIARNYINGYFALSGIHNVTGQVATNLNLHDNYVKNAATAVPALNFVSAVTGVAYRNGFEAGTTVNSAKFNTGMDVSIGNAGETGLLAAGSEFWYVKKGVVSSTILTTGVAISAASIGGDIAIEDVILKTNSVGLAGGTNLQIKSNNANGVLIFFDTTVASLGANATVNMASATALANGRTVLELGKILTVQSTVGNNTGAGTVDIYVKCKRLAPGADLSAA